MSVHYTGKLEDGKTFASSRDKGTPITVEVGDSQFPLGWNEGIEGMKVGELRELTVSPQIGFGALGNFPTVPPNATLAYEIELLKVHDASDPKPAEGAPSGNAPSAPGTGPAPAK